MDVEEDENIFSKSGFAIMNDYIQLNAFNIGAQRLGVSICLKDLV